MSATLTVRLEDDVKEKLTLLASRTKRTHSFLAAEAIEAYVAREIEIVEAIERGRADVAAGRVVPHEDAMAELEAVIAAAAGSRK